MAEKVGKEGTNQNRGRERGGGYKRERVYKLECQRRRQGLLGRLGWNLISFGRSSESGCYGLARYPLKLRIRLLENWNFMKNLTKLMKYLRLKYNTRVSKSNLTSKMTKPVATEKRHSNECPFTAPVKTWFFHSHFVLISKDFTLSRKQRERDCQSKWPQLTAFYNSARNEWQHRKLMIIAQIDVWSCQ